MNYLFLFLNVVCWTIAPLSIKWLGSYFDIHTQNFYRYLGASTLLLITARIIYPVQWHEGFKKLRKFLLPGTFMALTQILWVAGICLSKASLAMFVGKLDIIFVILLSYLIFKDERERIKTVRFKTGVAMVLIGVAGVVLGQGRVIISGIGLGVIFVFFSRISWALYAITVKKATVHVPPLISSSLSIAIATLFLLPIGLKWGNFRELGSVSMWVIVVLFGSGIIGVGIGQAFFHHNVKKVGTVLTSSFILSTPLFVLIAAYFLLGERLSVIQIISGLLVLAGCYIILPLVQSVPYRQGV